MKNDLEHPDITNARLTGYPCGVKDERIECPVCGAECEKFYTRLGEVLGCDHCIDEKEPYSSADDDR